jgi:hypothetical protein
LRVLVCGSRDWRDANAIQRALIRVVRRVKPLGGRVVVIHGDARGADRIAAALARGIGLEVIAFPADWSTHGRRAGFLRNLEMLDQRPDLVIAFQRNGSRGTQHTIDEARKRGIPVEVYTS